MLVFPAREGLDTRPAEASVEEAGFTLVPFGDVGEALEASGRSERGEDERRVRGLEQSLDDARRLYLEQDFDGMARVLEPALLQAAPALVDTAQCAALWEVEFQLGLAALSQGGPEGEREASEHFVAAIALDEGRRPEAALYGPAVTAAFLRAVDTRGRDVARPVAVERQPGSALVWIDCKARPDESASLRPGRHLVVGKAVGHRPWAGIVELGGGPIDVPLSPAPSAAAEFDAVWHRGADPEQAEVRAAVWAAADALELDAVLWVDQVGADAFARVVLRDEVARPSYAASQSAAASRALARLGTDGRLHALDPNGAGVVDRPEGPVVDPDAPTVLTPEEEAARRRRRRRLGLGLGLGLGGAAVLSLALGLGLGLGLADPEPGRLQVTVQ